MVKNPLLISGIFFLLSIVFVLILLWPKYQDFQILREKIERRETDLETQTAYFENLQKISTELKNYQSQLSKIDSALPKNLSLPEILNFLQYNASQSGLSFKKIGSVATVGFQSEETGLVSEEITLIKETTINLGFSGDYFSFKNFLSVLEGSARLFDFENIIFSLTEKGTEFDLTIKTYSY